jgi:hypothetical protein
MEKYAELFFTTLAIIFIVLIVWCAIIFILFLFELKYKKLWEKLTWKIYLSKSINYKGKTSPIYKIQHHQYEGYYIDRYSLKYNEVFEWFSPFLLYPIDFYKWGYSCDESIFICHTKEEIKQTLNGITIKVYYENAISDMEDKNKIEEIKKREINNIINDANKEFDDNYIK